MLTPERATLRAYLLCWWPKRGDAEELARQYAAARAEYPLVFADLARFCNAGDSSLQSAPDGRIDKARTLANEGRREVWLHVRQVLRMDEEDTENLLEESEA